jgi:hypothetical protein
MFESPASEGSLPDLTVSIGPSSFGDLNGDERDDAAVVLVERLGQRETLYNLHAVLAGDSTIWDAAWVLVGRRSTRIDDVRVDSGLIHVDLLGRQEEPGVRSIVYALTDKGLRLVDTPAAGQQLEAASGIELSGIELSGSAWTLVSIEMGDELVTPVFSARGDPSLVFTREFGDPDFGSGRVSGHAGCNRIFGSYRVGPVDSLSIGSIAMTEMNCAVPVMEIERLLVRALELMRAYERAGDELILEFVDGRLRFAASES